MLTPTQKAFATSREPFPCLVAGFGAGKSAAAIARAMGLKFHFKDCDVAYYLPTYGLVEDIAYRRFPELCERKNIDYKLNRSSAHIEFPQCGRIVFRTMENPDRIVGYEVAHSILDELDTLQIDKARNVWNKVIARNRQKCEWPNTVAVATTPEGFRFVYERWVKNPAPGYVLFRARTMENAANLPDGYIDNLRNSYPSNLLAAYLEGEFVNLAHGRVYPEFDREANSSDETIKPGEPLFVGMDFNVGKMAAVVWVVRGRDPHAVDEIVNGYDTPDMIRQIQGRYPGHRINVYPDASGGGRRSVDASQSDLALLRQARFAVFVNSTNPAIKDRVLAVNKLICTDGTRRLKVNVARCPSLVEAFEKQPYNQHGEPDKSTGLDHISDAAGYYLAYQYPIIQRTTTVTQISIR